MSEREGRSDSLVQKKGTPSGSSEVLEEGCESRSNLRIMPRFMAEFL